MKILNRWTVATTKTSKIDLRIIQGNYPWMIESELGDNIALVKSQSKSKTGFAKAGELNERDEGFAIAELISAAPEMYAAIIKLVSRFNKINYLHSEDKEAIENAKKTLRKAKPNTLINWDN